MLMKTKGVTGIEVLAAVAIVGIALWWFKPSIQKTAAREVDQVTNKVISSEEKIDQKISASVNQIGVANSMAPESPSKDFIAKEVQFITPLLPTPDIKNLLEAEKRRIAVMEGRLEEADKLYKEARKENLELLKELTVAKKELEELKIKLYESGAVMEYLKKIIIITVIFFISFLVGYIWLKINFGKVFGGLREFVTYTKDEKVLSQLREALDADIKKKLGL